jgi:predicted nucleic acid-binding protein
VAEVFVLDTSAWIALDEKEPGADEVEAILAASWLGRAEIHAAFVTLTELEYIRTREFDAPQAAELLAFVRAQRVTWHHSDDEWCTAAAKLKAQHTLSLADAFVAALARRLNATLVHKDPEFAALGHAVKQKMLPPKAAAAKIRAKKV